MLRSFLERAVAERMAEAPKEQKWPLYRQDETCERWEWYPACAVCGKLIKSYYMQKSCWMGGRPGKGGKLVYRQFEHHDEVCQDHPRAGIETT